MELTDEQKIKVLEQEKADLIKKVTQQEGTISKHETTIATQKGTIATQKSTIESQGKEVTTLTSTVAQKVEDIRVLESEAEANEETITRQAAQLKAAAVSVQSGKPTVEHNGQHYRVLVRKLHLADGSKVTAEELVARPELIAQLVADKSGALELVVEPAEA